MPVDWKHKDSFTRLLAAMVAAQDMKVRLPSSHYLLLSVDISALSQSIAYSPHRPLS